MDDNWMPFEDPIDTRPVKQGKWPHKCAECGRFVSHEAMGSALNSDGEYWAKADCGNCDKRVDANPI